LTCKSLLFNPQVSIPASIYSSHAKISNQSNKTTKLKSDEDMEFLSKVSRTTKHCPDSDNKLIFLNQPMKCLEFFQNFRMGGA